MKDKQTLTNWIDELNNSFQNKMCFYDPLSMPPTLIDEGIYKANDELIEEAKIISKTLRTDDLHAILSNKFISSANLASLRYKKLPFSQVTALRKQGKKPGLLTANLIAVDPHHQKVVLHRRSASSHVNPNRLSITGGGFWPDDGTGKDDSNQIINTAIREFREETNLLPIITDTTAIVPTMEIDIGAIQINFLGASTKINDLRACNWEGDIEIVHFDELCGRLTNYEWAPLGKSCVLAWLALGAPGAINPVFNGLTAEELYRKNLPDWC